MELEIIRWLKERLPCSDRVQLGPGDDAALVACNGAESIVLACDTITDGLDFILADCRLEQVGHKALAINLSDLAAMAARPVAATVSLTLPQDDALGICQHVTEGMVSLAERYQVDLVGGDITIWEGPLIITVNVVGEPGPGGTWFRHGAGDGDSLLVTGALGGSLLDHHLTFEPRVKEALYLASNYTINAAIDISDGLSLDTDRLAGASGRGAILNFEDIPVSPAAVTYASTANQGLSPVEHALQDGEDFELLLAVSEDQAHAILADEQLTCPVACIGTIVEDRGLWGRDRAGHLLPLPAAGYLHGSQ